MAGELMIDAIGEWLSIRGELDRVTAPELIEATSRLAGSSSVIDLRDVTFIDSGGVRALVSIAQTYNVKVCGASVGEFPSRVFEIVGADSIVLDGCPPDGGGRRHRQPLP